MPFSSSFLSSLVPGNITQHLTAAQSAQRSNKAIEDAAQTKAELQDPFWAYAALDSTLWNKQFPYQLVLLLRTDEGWVQNDSEIPPFTLPVPPEALSISVPWAINTLPTLGGIIEEHNGAPIRMITIQGTTGVLPLRGNPGSVGQNLGSFLGPAQSIFAGTLSGVQQITSAVNALVGSPIASNVVDDSSQDVGQGSGYYQFQLLRRFLESYSSFKKTAAGRNWMLGVALYKDQEIYLVSPMTFEMQRSAASPWEYHYGLQFKAWKRIKPNNQINPLFDLQPAARSPQIMAQVLNGLRNSRRVLEGARAVLQGIRADVHQVLFEPLRQATLFVKDFVGVINTAADLPANIQSDLKEPILEAINTQGTSNASFIQASAAPPDSVAAWKQLAVSSLKSTSNAGQADVASINQSAAPANKISADPLNNFSFYDAINPGALNLRASTQKKIADEKNHVRGLKRENFEAMVADLQALLADFEQSVGLGDQTFTETYSLPVRVPVRTATANDFETIYSLNESILQLEALAASSTINRDEVNAIDFIAGLASQSGIAFQTPVGKLLVPFPYGYTLEKLSQLYFNTPDRWHEIAALNGLEDPFVDETGFQLSLVANGNGNTISVADSSRLFTQQLIWIGSRATLRTQRRITRIEVISPDLSLVHVNGDPTMGQYRVNDQAYLQAFIPNTVNSLMQLYIPSDGQPDQEDFREKSIPGVNYFDPLVRVGGVDLLLTQDNDLVITPDGGGRLAVGLTNIIQTVKIVLSTPQGTLLHHPDYGAPQLLGESTAEVTARDMLAAYKNLLKGNPTFSGVNSVTVVKDGPSARVTFGVNIAGVNKSIPISVEVRQ